MNNFEYARASDVADAIKLKAADSSAKFIAGGTCWLRRHASPGWLRRRAPPGWLRRHASPG